MTSVCLPVCINISCPVYGHPFGSVEAWSDRTFKDHVEKTVLWQDKIMRVVAFEAHKTFLFLFTMFQFYDKKIPNMDSYIVRWKEVWQKISHD